ncbi:DUF6155 family protein [Salipaludibacillus sp. HK11]|uniref:DUF6155 family protein n=1 Tax=Salipaludibacillus sp. HK11 TaxID=3394320 RepID=UPI0039FBA220
MTTIKLNELKKELKGLNEKELTQIIVELYKVNKDAQELLSIKFIGDEAVEALFLKSKKQIKDEFFPGDEDEKLRLKEAKKSISNFKKMTNDLIRTVDLMLYYVEIGTEFTNTYGDIDESFYGSMVSMFEKVVNECLKNEELYAKFKDRMDTVVEDSDGIGWGYHDVLDELYFSMVGVMEE